VAAFERSGVFDVGLGEMLVLIVGALFVFGPDRLPQVVSQAARTLRQIRALAAGARAEINDAIGPELRDFNAMTGLGDLREQVTGIPDLRGLTPRKVLSDMLGPDKPAAAAAPVEPAAALLSAADGAEQPGEQPAELPAKPVAAPSPVVFDADAT
jgi:Sec-independent protein translocase protein TatA